MNKEELLTEVWALIDAHASDMSGESYLELLEELKDDAGVRAEAVQQELDEGGIDE
jgi:hypothetical protein